MDDDGFRNWGYYEPASFKGNLGLQLMSNIERNDTKPFLSSRDPKNLMIGANGSFHPRDCFVSEASIPMNYSWINQQKDKFFNMLPVNTPNYNNVLPETSGAQSMQILHPQNNSPRDQEKILGNNIKEEDLAVNNEEIVQSKKRQSGAATKAPKAKKPRKPKDGNNNHNVANISRVKPVKKSFDVVINGISMDISSLPVPVCTCTGSGQQCYRWGCGGWQSACCTTNISMHPLPMSTKRRGARISGRKMSQGAFKKVLEKLAAEGYNFRNPIDLKSHWARHGTNKFVTIR